MSKGRKHKIMVEITVNRPITAKQAKQHVSNMLNFGKYGSLIPNVNTFKITCKEGMRVLNAYHQQKQKQQKQINIFNKERICIANLCESDKGRFVCFYTNHGTKEIGILSSWNRNYIFVHFTEGDTAAACHPIQLSFVYDRA